MRECLPLVNPPTCPPPITPAAPKLMAFKKTSYQLRFASHSEAVVDLGAEGTWEPNSTYHSPYKDYNSQSMKGCTGRRKAVCLIDAHVSRGDNLSLKKDHNKERSMSKKIYMHEYIKITGANRARYFEHMTRAWREGAKARNQKAFGVWGTLGSTGNWPEVVNLWEYQSLEQLAGSFDHETSGDAMQDEFLKKWWEEVQPMRSGGYDRLLLPADYSPSIDETISRGIVGYRVFQQDLVQTPAGKARAYLDRVKAEWMPKAQELGMEMVGAYTTAMRDDSEALLIWAIRDWATWARAEQEIQRATDSSWRKSIREIALNSHSHLMCSAPLSPLQTGEQP